MAAQQAQKLADILVSSALVSEVAMESALAQQNGSSDHRGLGNTLIEMGAIHEEDLALTVAYSLGLDLVDLTSRVLDLDVASILPSKACRRMQLLPIERRDNRLLIAMADPTDVVSIDDVRLMTQSQIDVCVATASAVEGAIGRLEAGNVESDLEEIDLDENEGTSLRASQLVDSVLNQALVHGASDVHFEPQMNRLIVRLRVDGTLRTLLAADITLHRGVINRLKVLADLDITRRRVPQDGQMNLRFHNRSFSSRVSTFPSVHGEKIVMRVVDDAHAPEGLSGMGMDIASMDAMRRALRAPQGFVIVTGPTSSGKTTTLYAGLGEIAGPDKHILTLEDPVERRLDHAVQSDINEEAGVTFSTGLRAALRQDPDVIMVGEIRDAPAAEIALRAALTGHLVVTTMHTNDAASAWTRLLDMGMPAYLVASTVTLIVAQRLLRRVCPECRVPGARGREAFDEAAAASHASATPGASTGCVRCGQTGYRGRLGVFETLEITQDIADVIRPGVTSREISDLARRVGMPSLRERALAAAQEGLTSEEEVTRVVG